MAVEAEQGSGSSPVRLLRQYPLASFFLIALGFSWAVVIFVVATDLPTTFWTIVAITLGPTIAALVMTAVTEGTAGLIRFLKRFLIWRVNPVWYLFALVGIPAIFILGTVFLPGATVGFNPLTSETWSTYPVTFLLVLVVGGPLLEEPGRRGFALPRLEEKFGPLAGTIILALLWAVWHYPQYMMADWAAQNGGFNLSAVAVFTVSVLPLTIIISTVFNNTRGSLLLAILAHASINTFSIYVVQMFPAEATSQVNAFVGFGTAALLIVGLTAGRLGYDKYRRETQSTDGA